jgi:hypothetical protein
MVATLVEPQFGITDNCELELVYDTPLYNALK